MTDQKSLREFATIFRCSVEMAPVYVARIHERMGHEVAMDSVIAVMKKIPAKKLSMDTIIERLHKLEKQPPRKRAAKPSEDDLDTAGDTASARKAESSAPRKLSVMNQIEKILNGNWERGRKHGLKPPVMSAERFVKTTQSLAGVPKPSVVRVMQAILKLNKRDVLLTPNLVADEINESDVA